MRSSIKQYKVWLIGAMLAIVASAVSFRAWPATPSSQQPVAVTMGQSIVFRSAVVESVPVAMYDSSTSNVAIPFLKDGAIVLSQVDKGTATSLLPSTEITRQVVTLSAYRIADVNRQTGEYLFQTFDSAKPKNISGVVTWIGDASGKSTRVISGVGYVKLSPGGSFIAGTDQDGVLRIFGRDGKERASFGMANNVIFSPDGKQVAFFKMIPYSAGDAGGLAVVDLLSKTTVATYDPEGGVYVPLAFSEDGKILFFATKTKTNLLGPSDQNRVDVYALDSTSSKTVARLITTGVQKLPYIDYARVQYVASVNKLVLSGSDTIWSIDTQTGNIQTFSGVNDAIWSGLGGAFFAHSTDKNASDKMWQILNIR